MLTFYTKQPGGNLLHKHKTVKSDVVEERPTTCTMYIQISYTDLEKQEDARRCLRGMCGFKKELCWMAMES